MHGGPGDASTPARAGRTRCPDRCSRGPDLYPRSCGEDNPLALGRGVSLPLPPLVRGGLDWSGVLRRTHPSTPARAGRTPVTVPRPRCPTLYPRSCGEDMLGDQDVGYHMPLPPLVRGGPGLTGQAGEQRASTPARAGRTVVGPTPPRRRRLYPRSCGEDQSLAGPSSKPLPLPPLVRGGLSIAPGGAVAAASTPARAGRTRRVRNGGAPTPLYPRSCGEDSPRSTNSAASAPLPPLVRGGPRSGYRPGVAPPSTPARAGRTGRRAGPGRGRDLYPRSCGEDPLNEIVQTLAQPLPPLVRGGHWDSGSS